MGDCRDFLVAVYMVSRTPEHWQPCLRRSFEFSYVLPAMYGLPSNGVPPHLNQIPHGLFLAGSVGFLRQNTCPSLALTCICTCTCTVSCTVSVLDSNSSQLPCTNEMPTVCGWETLIAISCCSNTPRELAAGFWRFVGSSYCRAL